MKRNMINDLKDLGFDLNGVDNRTIESIKKAVENELSLYKYEMDEDEKEDAYYYELDIAAVRNGLKYM